MDSDARESYNPGLSAVLLLDPSVNGGNEVVRAKWLGVRTPVVLSDLLDVVMRRLGKLLGGGNSPEFCGPLPLGVKLPWTMNRC